MKILVRAVEEKIRENRRFTITPLSLHFPQISRSLLHKIVSEVKEDVTTCFPSQAASFYDEGIQKLVQRYVHQMAIYMACNIFLFFFFLIVHRNLLSG